MTALLIVLASIAAYLGIGWLLAKRDMPEAWLWARQRWTFDDERARRSVMEQTIGMIALWPLLSLTRAVVRVVDDAIDQADPKAREREMKQREQELRRMERELGIGRSS